MKSILKFIFLILIIANVSNYALSQGTLKITSPVTKDLWASTEIIKWTFSNVNLVKLEYTIDGGKKWILISDTNKASARQVNWNCPNLTSANCLIKISDKDNPLIESTSGTFKIIPTPTPKDYTIPIKVTLIETPPSIKFQWDLDTNMDQYTIERKRKEDIDWVDQIADLPYNATSFIDTKINIGESYEYRIIKTNRIYSAYQYMFCGIKSSINEFNGTLLLLVEESLKDSLNVEIKNLKTDLIGDGWNVITKYISSKEKVPDVKKIVKTEYNTNKVKSIFILGHVPVPYSGNIAPDGHPDHVGAWPADVFYADIDDELWSDTEINNSKASRTSNKNIPNDGKYDQGELPSRTEMQIGRVDLVNMSQFKLNEIGLLKMYLEKNHKFKLGINRPIKRGLIDDNFGMYGSVNGGFATTSWGGFYSNLGVENTFADKYIGKLSKESYLFSYGCGGGTYTSCGGVGTTSDFVNNEINSVFTFLFGSYFGDWDVDNSFLRAPLAANGMALTSAWSGRPFWHIHHMALGESIGYSAFVSQNNQIDNIDIYNPGFAAPGVHVALMGDPTLRSSYVLPVKNLILNSNDNSNELKWDQSSDNVIGYNVYSSKSINDKFRKINKEIIKSESFIDSNFYNGKNVYMIRAVKLEKTPSGSYYNMSIGLIDSIIGITPQLTNSPNLIFPKKDTINSATNGYVKFGLINRAESYNIQISINNNFQDPLINSNQIDSVYLYKNLKSQTKYYWRVQGVNSSSTSPWSEVWTFTTGSISDVVISNRSKLPKQLKLK